MNVDEIYRDEASAASIPQLRGRPSLRLAPLPSTPPPPTPLKCCDTNTMGNAKQTRYLRSRRGVLSAVRTAPTSPVELRPRAVPPQRPLTPTVTAAPPRPRGPALIEPNDDNVGSGWCFPQVVGGVTAAGGGSAGEEEQVEGEEESLALSSRWVSFSFASALTSRRQSESCQASPSPRPRAAILPSNFPDLHLSDEEDAPTECVTAATSMRRTPTSAPPPPSPRRPWVAFHDTSVEALKGEEKEEDEQDGLVARGRRSLLLTSAPVPHALEASPTAGMNACPSEGEGLQPMRRSHGKRERSAPPSPWTTSFVLCDRASSCHVATVTGTRAAGRREEDVATEAKRSKTESSLLWPQTHAEVTRREGTAEHDTESGPSAVTVRSFIPTADGGASMVLVDGPTPTPWRERFAPPLPPVAAAGGGESECRVSMVVDIRSSDTVVTPKALFGEATAADDDAVNVQEGGRAVGAEANVVVLRQHNARDAAATAVCGPEAETPTDKTVGDGCGASDESFVVPTSCARPSDELKALIESTREEVRQASERIIAALHAHRCTSCEEGGGVGVSVGGEDCTLITDSLQLAVGRALTGPSGDAASSSSSSPWISTESGELRRELAARAGCILRRLRGYDHTDAGILPMAVVARVVRQVLFHDATADATPGRCSEGSVNLSWGLASPSLVCCATPEAQQKPQGAEESAMELCMSLWRCFRERFGARHTATRFGIMGSADADGDLGGSSRSSSSSGSTSHTYAFATCFPRVRLQLSPLGQPLPSSPPQLDTCINYSTFAASLVELN
ncbi:hypothetical protein TraAM80_01667 [Trypanosoma rangeli]|uniref:Uncharacterized protein n=1 Tax=Trypanosoma rangeli TaxID=5698 RepID=A0A3S5IS82_TRYRA|nr:uncharacterized protein TraAM80_01667 [Trypanosoma rangeli]RNF10228.1 hypothetical protein TraAM80_01667 [Trypanosoma rangeli]|eukprot:RNF10228.1 hypothetical protein TraAM80_01667 [Trypanosoma rangeli]